MQWSMGLRRRWLPLVLAENGMAISQKAKCPDRILVFSGLDFWFRIRCWRDLRASAHSFAPRGACDLIRPPLQLPVAVSSLPDTAFLPTCSAASCP